MTSRIIDSHAYCFPPLAQANGFPDAGAHLRYLQREMADHHQPVWRLRDRALAGDNTMLADPRDRTLAGLTNVDFRAGGHGRFVWTVDGEDYAKQYLPPYLTDLSHPPQMLVAQMDHVGVDRAVLQVNPIMGLLNDYVAECVRQFPDRLLGLVSVREWRIDAEPDTELAEVERAYALGLHGLQFIVNARHRHGVLGSWDGPACRAFWDGVTGLGRPILFTIAPVEPKLESYLEQLRIWGGWLDRYPQANVVMTHGFPWRLFLDDGGLELPDAIFEPFRASSAKLQLLFQISLGRVFDFPYRELHPVIERLVEVLGSQRLMWGTDMPNVERFCNYRQTLDTFRVHCRGLLSDAEIDNIVGLSAARTFDLIPNRSSRDE